MTTIDAGSSKRIGIYELMLSKPIGRWDVLDLTIYRWRNYDVKSRRMIYSTGYISPPQFIRDLYKRLNSVKAIEEFLRRRAMRVGKSKVI